MSSTFNFTTDASNEHIMILYNNDDDRNNVAVNLINEGLKNEFHCIYASVHAYDSENKSNVSNLSRLSIIKRILKKMNCVLLILSLIMNQHVMM
jgi:hypothetical protein